MYRVRPLERVGLKFFYSYRHNSRSKKLNSDAQMLLIVPRFSNETSRPKFIRPTLIKWVLESNSMVQIKSGPNSFNSMKIKEKIIRFQSQVFLADA